MLALLMKRNIFVKTKPASKKKKAVARRNPVAKHASKFNRAAAHQDRKKALKKGAVKHRGKLVD